MIKQIQYFNGTNMVTANQGKDYQDATIHNGQIHLTIEYGLEKIIKTNNYECIELDEELYSKRNIKKGND